MARSNGSRMEATHEAGAGVRQLMRNGCRRNLHSWHRASLQVNRCAIRSYSTLERTVSTVVKCRVSALRARGMSARACLTGLRLGIDQRQVTRGATPFARRSGTRRRGTRERRSARRRSPPPRRARPPRRSVGTGVSAVRRSVGSRRSTPERRSSSWRRSPWVRRSGSGSYVMAPSRRRRVGAKAIGRRGRRLGCC